MNGFIKNFLLILCAKTLVLIFQTKLQAALLVIGGGYYEAGPRHSGPVFQIEYRMNTALLEFLRPEAVLVTPTFNSVFLGIGGFTNLHLGSHLVCTPSFTAGLYERGKGRDLGHVVEFREAIEFCYEWKNKVRFGFQFSHISNASLSQRNPGANAYSVILAYPFPRKKFSEDRSENL